jgi:hypothetical protein
LLLSNLGFSADKSAEALAKEESRLNVLFIAVYDLQTDPHERHNLINIPAFTEKKEVLKKQLFAEHEASGALEIPIRPPKGEPLHDRKLRR